MGGEFQRRPSGWWVSAQRAAPSGKWLVSNPTRHARGAGHANHRGGIDLAAHAAGEPRGHEDRRQGQQAHRRRGAREREQQQQQVVEGRDVGASVGVAAEEPGQHGEGERYSDQRFVVREEGRRRASPLAEGTEHVELAAPAQGAE
jgi:hypothetical protein